MVENASRNFSSDVLDSVSALRGGKEWPEFWVVFAYKNGHFFPPLRAGQGYLTSAPVVPRLPRLVP